MSKGERIKAGERFLSDAPIRLASEDCYGRSANATTLAGSIRHLRTDESFVIGFSGEWGSGKTSFINMVCESLRNPEHGEAATTVVTFNPWLIEDRKALLGSFFAALAAALPKQDNGQRRKRDGRNNLSGLILQYSSVLTEGSVAAAVNLVPVLASLGGIPATLAGPVLLGSARFVSNKLANKLSVSNPSLDDLRRQISDGLRDLDENVVVVIDDVDRLSSDEIRLVFKLVTLSASFPRITYLLSFDREVVSKALADVQGIDGRRYLEKVVQLDVEMPPLEPDFVSEQLNSRLTPLFVRDHFYKEERDGERLRVCFRGLIMLTLTTPRKVTRYINHVLSKYWAISDEVCLVDVLGLAAIELAAPKIFEKLWAERNLICRGGQSYLLPKERKQRIEAIKKTVDEELPHDLTRNHAIGMLFPDTSLASSAIDLSSSTETARAEGRVCCLDLFSYYRGGFYLPALDWEEAEKLVKDANERDLIDSFANAVEEGRLIDFCHTISGHLDGLTAERACRMVYPTLLCLGKSDEYYQALLLRSDADEELTRLLGQLGSEAGAEQFSNALTESLPKLDADNFAGMSWLIGDELLARDERTTEDGSTRETRKTVRLTDEALDELLGTYCKMLAAHGDDAAMRANFRPFSIWESAAERIGSDSYRRFTDSVLLDPRRYVLYYAGRLVESFSSGRYAHCYGRGTEADDLDAEIIESAMRERGWLNDLREPAKEKVAALYLLSKGSEGTDPDRGVPDWAARNQLARWGV